jgi:hypothetical protein
MIDPRTSKPITYAYIHAYGIGYHVGYEHGDEDVLRATLIEKFGESDADNTLEYSGAQSGYTDGVEDYALENE